MFKVRSFLCDVHDKVIPGNKVTAGDCFYLFSEILVSLSFGFSGKDCQFENSKYDFGCGITVEIIFQVFVVGVIFEINGWSPFIEIKKKVRSVIVDTQAGKLI